MDSPSGTLLDYRLPRLLGDQIGFEYVLRSFGDVKMQTAPEALKEEAFPFASY
jgi:hypothetical protein